MATNYFLHKTKGYILKVDMDLICPKVRIYKSLDLMNTPDEFTSYKNVGYPAPDELLTILATPKLLNTTNSLYGLAKQATYDALKIWITNNPGGVNFGSINDWTEVMV
jgi:hypothetical protein